MYLTLTQAEKALLRACIKHTDWQYVAGFRYRVFQMPPGYDCSDLPDEFEVLFSIGDNCIVREQIDDFSTGGTAIA